MNTTLKWNTGTGRMPKLHEVITNYYGDKFEVVKVKGATVTLKKLNDNNN